MNIFRMKWFLLVCCGFVAIISTADARNLGVEGDGRCTESRTWKEDCNSCSCEKGFYPLCTLMLCTQTQHEVIRSTLCEPDEMIKQDCNECRCTSDGTDLICTKRSCVSKVSDDVSELEEQVTMRQVCEPNEPFDKECNRCVCNDEGSAFTCTQNFCADDSPNDVEVFNNTEASDHSERQQVCVPNKNFKRDCNTCKCNQDGTDFSCTRKFCLEMEDVEVMEKDQDDLAATFRSLVCSPNESFEKGCNKCRCNEMGTAYSCTRKVCAIPSPADDMEALEYRKQGKKTPPKTQQKCEPRSVFKVDCNTCQCSDDGTSYYCTRRACLLGLPDDYDTNIPDDKEDIATPEQSREKREIEQNKFPDAIRSCNPNEEFRLDCNTCLCNGEGKDYSCSRNDCQKQSVSKRSVDDESVRSCLPGSVFQDGCRTCICSPEGRIAECIDDACIHNSERVARDTKPPTDQVCKPGESTTRDCNTCLCSEDGKQLNCTERSCSFDALTPKEIAGEDPDFRCTPGDQYKRDCNDCTCSANGRSVFCTLKLCV